MSTVTYEFEAAVSHIPPYEHPEHRAVQWVPLPVTDIVPSIDLDRVSYTTARIICGAVDQTLWELLDPRNVDPSEGGQVRWRIRQLDLNGTVLAHLPQTVGDGADADEWATMYVRTAHRTLDTVTVTLDGGETMIEDRLVIEDTSRFAGGHEISSQLAEARTLGEYVDIILTMTFGPTHATRADPVAEAAAAVPVHSTFLVRGMNVPWPAPAGASFLQLVETELSALGCRLLDAWGIGWFIADRTNPPTFEDAPDTVKWATHTDDLPDDVQPIITGFFEKITRDGDWADTVVVEGDDGEARWQHTAAGGTGSRGLILKLESAEPSANLAASIAHRAFRRGHDIEITARIDFHAVPGMLVEAHLKRGILSAEVVSIEWRPLAGEMTVRARSARTITIHETQTRERHTVNELAEKTATDLGELHQTMRAESDALAHRATADQLNQWRWR